MIYTEKLRKAVKFAIKTHEVYQKQKRKGKDIPYITHPLTVGIILARARASEDVIIAGVLHDTIEDSAHENKVSRTMIEERFGKKVAELVADVTESKELARDKRKQQAIERIKTFSHDSLLVKSADILSNTRELIEDFKKHGDKTFGRFNAPKDKTLEHYDRAINEILNSWPKNPLNKDLREVKAILPQL